MKALNNSLPLRFDSSELQKPIANWLLPEVTGRHTVGFYAKKAQLDSSDIIVIDEEIVAEKVTLSELEAIRERAYEEGFSAGETVGNKVGQEAGQEAGDLRGYEEALARGKVDLDKQLAQLEGVLLALDQPLHQQHEQIAALVAQLSTHIAEVVTKQQASEYKSIVEASVTAAIAQLPKQSGELLITVHPEDAKALTSLAEKYKARWRLLEDPEISLGGCIVSTDTSVVDYCMESRFSDVIEQLKNRLDAPPELDTEKPDITEDLTSVDDNPLESEKGDESV